MAILDTGSAVNAGDKSRFVLFALISLLRCASLSAQDLGGGSSQHAGPTSTNSALLTYRNSRYGISLEYPANYVLTEGEKELGVAWILAGSGDHYEQPHRVMLVTVELPNDTYPGTDFGGAFVHISVSPERIRDDCQALLDSSDGKPSITVINGTKFSWNTAAEASTGTGSSENDYVSFQRGICYEITLGLVIIPGDLNTMDDERILPVDSKDIQRRLNVILHSVIIRPTKRAK